MASFAILPDELHLQIAGYLEGDNKTLSWMSKSCRAASAAAQEVLFRTINVDATIWSAREAEQGAAVRPRFSCLVRTLLDRPDLAAKIRRLRFQMMAFRRNESFEQDIQKMFKKMFETIRECLWKSTHPEGYYDKTQHFHTECKKRINTPDSGRYVAQWSGSLRRGCQTAYAGLLFVLIPNMAEFEFWIHHDNGLFSWSNAVLGELFLISARKPVEPSLLPLFSGLTSVKILRSTGAHLDILALPWKGLRHLDLLVSRIHTYFANEVLASSCTSMDSLTLRSNWRELSLFPGSTPFLPQVFSILDLPRLRNLYLTMDEPGPYVARRHDQESFANVISNLDGVSSELEVLKIDHNPEKSFLRQGWDKGNVQQINTLRNLHHLRHFTVLHDALVHHDYCRAGFNKPDLSRIFPETLETLTVTSPRASIVSYLHDLCRVLVHYPHLRCVNLVCRDGLGKSAEWFRLQEYQVLKDMELKGIALDIAQDTKVFRNDQDETHINFWDGDWNGGWWTASLLG